MIGQGLKIAITAVLASGLFALLGWFLGPRIPESWPEVNWWTTAIYGILVGTSIGLYLANERRRLAGALWLTAAFLAAYVLDEWRGVLFAMSTIAITFGIAASLYTELYPGGVREAIRHQWYLLTARSAGFQVIDDKKAARSAGSPVLGPRLVIVSPGIAVVMVSGPKITRICGPSIFTSGRFEYVDQILRLRPKLYPLVVDQAITSDLVPISVELSLEYGLDVSQDTIEGKNGSTKLPDGSHGLLIDERNLLGRLVSVFPDWEEMLVRHLRAIVRDCIAGFEIEDLVSEDGFEGLTEEITYKASIDAGKFGVRLRSLQVADLRFSEEILESRTRLVIARAEAGIQMMREKTRGEARAKAIEAIAKGYRNATKDSEMDLEDVRREADRLMMEHMSESSASRIIVAPNPRDILRNSLGADVNAANDASGTGGGAAPGGGT